MSGHRFDKQRQKRIALAQIILGILMMMAGWLGAIFFGY